MCSNSQRDFNSVQQIDFWQRFIVLRRTLVSNIVSSFFLQESIGMTMHTASMIITSMRSNVLILTTSNQAIWFTLDLERFLGHWHGETSKWFKNRSPFSWVTQERRDLQKDWKPVSRIASNVFFFEDHCAIIYWVINFIAVEIGSELGHQRASAQSVIYN